MRAAEVEKLIEEGASLAELVYHAHGPLTQMHAASRLADQDQHLCQGSIITNDKCER